MSHSRHGTKSKLRFVMLILSLFTPIFFAIQISAQTPAVTFQPSAPYHATFFYPWYKNPNTDASWSYWSDIGNNPPNTWFSHYIPNPYPQVFDPARELYSANNYDIFKWQLSKLAEARQEVAISSWWGPNTKEDIALGNIVNDYMHRADNPYPNLRWAIYYEDEGFGDPSVSTIVADLQHIRARFVQSPYFLRVNGKPVVFVYDQGSASTLAQRWAEANQQMGNEFYIVLKVYTGFATSPYQPDSWHQYGPANRYGIHAPYSAYVSPGFWLDDGSPARLLRNPAEFRTAVQSLAAANVTWRLVETWNEWGEGTSVEPGQEVMLDALGREVVNPNAVVFDNVYVQILSQYLPGLEQGTGNNALATQTATAIVTATRTPTATVTATRTPTAIVTATQAPTATRTPTVAPTIAPNGVSVTLTPLADSYVSGANPSVKFGTNASLRTDASPTMRSYIRFDVPNSGTIVSATLRLYSTSSNPTGFTVKRSSNTWDELTITSNNAPAPSGSYGISAAISANTWTQVNISSLVTAGGQYSIVVTSPSNTTTAFSSRESVNKPQLVIVYANMTTSLNNTVGSSLAVPIQPITTVPTTLPTLTATIMPTGTAITLPTETAIVLPTQTAITLPTNTAIVLPTNTALPTALPSNTAVPPTAVPPTAVPPTTIPTVLPTETPVPVLPSATPGS